MKMLNEIEIKGFKSFKHAQIPLRPLTLLSGLNNTGKSSVLQGLRMFCGSFEKNSPLLLGHGPVDELRSRSVAPTDPISISCKFSDDIRATFSLSDTTVQTPLNAPLSCYLSADRWGPKISLPLDRRLAEFPSIGNQGEYVAAFLDSLRNVIVPKQLQHPEAQGVTLEYQIIGWLREIAPGVDLRYEIDSKRDAAHVEFNSFRPTNVGFGLSYCLPILAAILGLAAAKPATGWENEWGEEWERQKADRGLVIMIENPEAHLHPSGQTALGRLLALGARCGLQLVIETHSDHLMDGIRIAVRDGELACDQVVFHYFARSSEGETTVQTPELHPSGKLSFWPNGFFDQTLKNRSKLAR
jgi:predicted ATPase